jgi:hypothetical protein
VIDEHREHPRYAIELDAEILAGGERLAGRTRDLSMGGFCLLTGAPLPVSTACMVRLALVFASGQFSEHLRVPATVVWCTPLRGQFQVGVKFEALEPRTQGYLTMFLHFLDEED